MAILETRFDKQIFRCRKRWLASAVVLLVSLLFVSCKDGGQQRWGPFRGQVVDMETGRPMPGVHVMAEWRQTVLNPVDSISKFYDAKETATDASGRFEIPRLERWSYWAREPDFKFFAPGYQHRGYEVTPPHGRHLVDPTVVKMLPLKTREERCAQRGGGPLHDNAPRFRDAAHAYELDLRCHELREHPQK